MRTLLVFLLATLFTNPAYSANDWKLVRTIGKIAIVVVKKERVKERELYRYAIAEVCGIKDWCKVLFWADESLTPTKLPMTEAQVHAQVASWTRNAHTGYKKFLWACRIVTDPNECFSP